MKFDDRLDSMRARKMKDFGGVEGLSVTSAVLDVCMTLWVKIHWVAK